MSRRPLPGLVASLVLHAVLVGAVLTALPRSELLPALFVDLTDAALREGPAGVAEAPPAAARVRARPPAEPPAPSASPRAIPSEAPASSLATSELPAAVPVAPAAPSPAPTLPPPVTFPSDATASAPSLQTPAPSAPAPAEPELPFASAALNDNGDAAPGEPSPVPTRGTRGLDAATRGDAVPSEVEVAVAPDLRAGPAIQGDGRSVRAGAGQEIARRSPGSQGGEAPQALYSEYLARLRQRVHESLRYPAAARRRGLAGGVTIELTILPSGAIRDVSIVESSSHPLLDQAALDTVRELRAQPFPTNVPPRTLRVRLPVVFRLE